MKSTEIEERLVIGEDLTGHTGCNQEKISKIHGRHGMREMNEEGELITDFVLAFDLAINNTFITSEENKHKYIF